MEKSEIVRKIENFAPLETQEKWDCSGWLVQTEKQDVKKIMLCLTVTEDVVRQAKAQNCDMIVSHHPLFVVPLAFYPSPQGGRGCHEVTGEGCKSPKLLDIYCAHTNLDKAQGGTTDTLIDALGLKQLVIANECEAIQPFVKYVAINISVDNFLEKLKQVSPNLRYVNNYGAKTLNKIAFCAGSGAEFIQEAYENGADAFVTGDLKFHTALDSPIVVFDIGHFESEILVLPVFERIIGDGVEYVYAKETSPFKYLR